MSAINIHKYATFFRGFLSHQQLLHRIRINAGPIMTQALCLLLLTLLLVLEASINTHIAQAASALKISEGDEWHYFKGTEKPPGKWTSVGFNDSSWPRGRAGFGYGTGQYMTFLDDMRGRYVSVYARRDFTISKPSAITKLTLTIVCDASFKAYLNGIEVIRNNSRMDEPFDISGFTHELYSGNNVLAIQCDNNDIESESYSFNPALEVSYE